MALTNAERQAAWRQRQKLRLERLTAAARGEPAPELSDDARAIAMRWLEDVRLPIYESELAAIKEMLSWPRYAVMSKTDYNNIMRCLHPDSLHSRTEEQLAEAFRLFTRYKPKMIDEEAERLTVLRGLPQTREELLRRKKRAASK